MEESELKKFIGEDVASVLSQYLDSMLNDKLENRNFVGKVVDNNDPEKLGRCKIVVYGIFSEQVPPSDLPWAIPEFGFVGSKKGSFIVPAIGAIVKVEFESDEISLPRYSTKVLNIDQLPTNKNKNYPNNMIFFETDNGDSFEIDRSTSETTFNHKSGTTVTIDPTGNVTIDHAGTVTDTGSNVVPDVKGPYCAIPVCPLTGASHIGQTCAPGL